jgi:hypothetical protein
MSNQPPQGPPEGWEPPPQGQPPPSRQPQGQGWRSPSPQGPPKPSGWPPGRIVAVTILGVLALMVLISALTNGSNTGSGSSSDKAANTVTVEVITYPSDLCWSGTFGDRTVDGCGIDTIDLKPMPGDYYVANAQIQRKNGSLTLVLKVGDTEIDSTTTEAAFGIATVQGTAR